MANDHLVIGQSPIIEIDQFPGINNSSELNNLIAAS